MKLSKNLPNGISITISYDDSKYAVREALSIAAEHVEAASLANDVYDYFNILRGN